ncbi:hypothetical protein [Emticicia sp. BO119]|uniref:hypothetical protein n=1 Tax=Emticicia sp. BO119 TaxID=2757768 RepID=UPI0015F0F736|nr:hypothetical protein [Emticicia sp. BO119]MBA4852077.1 hypothetical protein [Emticicia sp. BO119]
MKTTAHQDNILYNLINTSALKTLVLGGLYKGERPLDSREEDIVITSMMIGEGTLQEGVANVNIYIPKSVANIGGKSQTIKNTARCEQVLIVAMEVLKESYGSYYSLWASRQQDFDEPEINQTRLSFRIEFRIDSST